MAYGSGADTQIIGASGRKIFGRPVPGTFADLTLAGIAVQDMAFNGYAYVGVLSNGTVLQSFNGNTWTRILTPKAVNLGAVIAVGTRFIAMGYADASNGNQTYIVTSDNHGITWTQKLTGNANVNRRIVALAQNPVTKRILGINADGNLATLPISDDNGVTFGYTGVPASSGNIRDVLGIGGGIQGRFILLDCGTKAFVNTSDLNANPVTYVDRAVPKAITIWSAAFNGNTIVAVGDLDGVTDAYIIQSSDFGNTWVERPNPRNLSLHGVCRKSNAPFSEYFVVGNDRPDTFPYALTLDSNGLNPREENIPKFGAFIGDINLRGKTRARLLNNAIFVFGWNVAQFPQIVIL